MQATKGNIFYFSYRLQSTFSEKVLDEEVNPVSTERDESDAQGHTLLMLESLGTFGVSATWAEH